ncbi:hypothetical protein KKF91_21040 [Myxococcota bacterium]|nr:hypothetical protein [Myxococcota bacterium]
MSDDLDLEDALDDLHHDLGKYIALPLSLLPLGASQAALREALRRGLLETRRVGGACQGAEALWRGFLEEAPQARSRAGFAALEAAIAAALAWIPRLEDEAPLDEARARADLTAVRAAIRALMG